MDTFATTILDRISKFKKLDKDTQSLYSQPTETHFAIGTRTREELNYAFERTPDYFEMLVKLAEETYRNPEKNCNSGDLHQILGYDKPIEFISEPYFTLSPNGLQLRYWLGPFDRVTFDHVDSAGKNLLFSISNYQEFRRFVSNFCSRHSILIPKYEDY
jgi:hypothetical protein